MGTPLPPLHIDFIEEFLIYEILLTIYCRKPNGRNELMRPSDAPRAR